LVLQSQFIPGYINYANFLQQQQKEQAAFKVLQEGLKINIGNNKKNPTIDTCRFVSLSQC
jgi:hypothetical protein